MGQEVQGTAGQPGAAVKTIDNQVIRYDRMDDPQCAMAAHGTPWQPHQSLYARNGANATASEKRGGPTAEGQAGKAAAACGRSCSRLSRLPRQLCRRQEAG